MEDRPEPITVRDNPFANNTIIVRLPAILQRVIDENPTFPENILEDLKSLKESLPNGEILPISGGDDEGNWKQDIAGKTWMDLTFLFAEGYFYRRIVELTRYFDPSSPTYHIDPYKAQKLLGLHSSAPMIEAYKEAQETLRGSSVQERLRTSILASLWGNKADLSLWPVTQGEKVHVLHGTDEHILSNHIDDVVQLLMGYVQLGDKRVDIVVDNAGSELFSDLCLANALISTHAASKVVFHVKGYPVFVSDVLEEDIMDTIAFVENAHFPWRRYLETGQWEIRKHNFWATTQPFWDMPDDVRHDLSSCDLVLVKGDANYRRLIGDLQWPFTTPFDAVVNYAPCPIVALRALKSEVCVGLHHSVESRVATQDAQWMVNGQWGLIQLSSFYI